MFRVSYTYIICRFVFSNKKYIIYTINCYAARIYRQHGSFEYIYIFFIYILLDINKHWFVFTRRTLKQRVCVCIYIYVFYIKEIISLPNINKFNGNDIFASWNSFRVFGVISSEEMEKKTTTIRFNYLENSFL